MDFRKKLLEFLEDYQQMRKTQTEYFILKKKCPGLAGGILIRSKEQEKDLDNLAKRLTHEVKDVTASTTQYNRIDMRKAFDAGCDREGWLLQRNWPRTGDGADTFEEFMDKIDAGTRKETDHV